MTDGGAIANSQWQTGTQGAVTMPEPEPTTDGPRKRAQIVRVYMGNYDGSRQGLVVAASQKEAAKIARTSVYTFRQYWSARAEWPLTKLKLGVLYTRKYDTQNEWQEGICQLHRGKIR